jgi:6-phosphogluconolactonase/glucosamine-6-phosphate isomerase/deaminase
MHMSNAMGGLQIFKQSDAQSAAAEAGEQLNLFLAENKKRPVLLMLSAGSSLAILEYVGKTALGANLSISMLDERFTPLEARAKGAADADGNLPLTGFSRDPLINLVRSKPPGAAADALRHRTSNEVNNFSQLQKTDFYTDAFEAEASFFGTLPRDGESPEDLRQRWDKNLTTWRAENPTGLIAATLGMGADGHTAGILPFPENPMKFEQLFNSGAWTSAYNAGSKSKYPERVTTTITFLRLIDFGFAFVADKEKQEIFTRLTSGNVKTAEIPANVWHEMKNVKVFTPLEARAKGAADADGNLPLTGFTDLG